MAKYKVNKMKRVIWTNNDYCEWEKAMLEDFPTEESREEEGITIDYNQYCEDCEMNLYDERANLNKEVDGVIVVFANLGLWTGRHNGSGIVGTNVRDILSSECDYVTWYCDPWNVRCDAIHHDGTNHYLYRVAKDRETALRLMDKVAYHGMTEAEFRRATKPLRKYVADVYGW